MAFENIPTPQQMADNWYSYSNGQCWDCDDASPQAREGYEKLFLPLLAMNKDTPPIDGVPQVKYVCAFCAAPGFDPDPTLMACYDRANQLALDNPAWAKKVGQDGLVKVAIACMFEAMGRIPDGYMQELINALANKPAAFDKRWLWAGAAVGAYLLFFRK